MLFLFVFGVDVVFSIRIGLIRNTTYIASNVDQSYLNLTCTQCICVALQVYAVGWNCMKNNNTCQLINTYSANDVGLISENNTDYFFYKLPPEPLSTTTLSITTISTTVATASHKTSTSIMATTTISKAATTTTTTKLTTSLPCSTSNRGRIDTLSSSSYVSWTRRVYNYTALTTTATIVFGINGLTQQCLFLDDISIVDIVNPSVQLLNNPGFENSTTALTGWDLWCSLTCKNGTAGRITSGTNCRSSSNCYRDQCSDPHAVDFLVQTFQTRLNHTYTISFWYQVVQLISGGSSLSLYVDII